MGGGRRRHGTTRKSSPAHIQHSSITGAQLLRLSLRSNPGVVKAPGSSWAARVSSAAFLMRCDYVLVHLPAHVRRLCGNRWHISGRWHISRCGDAGERRRALCAAAEQRLGRRPLRLQRAAALLARARLPSSVLFCEDTAGATCPAEGVRPIQHPQSVTELGTSPWRAGHLPAPLPASPGCAAALPRRKPATAASSAS